MVVKSMMNLVLYILPDSVLALRKRKKTYTRVLFMGELFHEEKSGEKTSVKNVWLPPPTIELTLNIVQGFVLLLQALCLGHLGYC